MRTTINPLSINSGVLGNSEKILPGAEIEIFASVKNQGDQNAVIDVAVEIVDEQSLPLAQWIAPRRVRLALAPQESQTVLFQVCIPNNAWPYGYQYDLVIDSPEHYPEYTPLHYPHILKVLSPLLVSEHGKDPVFFLNPLTTSLEPRLVTPGEIFEFEIMIDNCSYLVDRFHVICTELDSDYFSVIYPEGRDQYGLIVESDGLELNPGEKRTVKLKIHPPANIPAGNYFPTIRLKSANNPNLNLLDVIYIYIPPNYNIEANIEPIINRIKNPKIESGEYNLQIINQGNIERNFTLYARNLGWGSLNFTLDKNHISLSPGYSSKLNLLVKPTGKWWNRPFYGIGRKFRFGVQLEDLQQLPIHNDLLENELTWESYSRKIRFLIIGLLALLAVMGVSAIAFFVWQYFFKQLPSPKIDSLSSEKNTYQESKNESIRLSWVIRNAKSIEKVKLIQKLGNGNTEIKTYDFVGGRIPVELTRKSPNQNDNYCDYQKRLNAEFLICRNIDTKLKQPGNYEFEIQAFKKKEQAYVSTQKTDTIKIISAGVAKITEFYTPRNNYIASSSDSVKKQDQIVLNLGVSTPTQIGQLRLVSYFLKGNIWVSGPSQNFTFQNGKLPKELTSYCRFGETLFCQNIPTNTSKAGFYTFRMFIAQKQGQEDSSLAKTTEAIEIKPDPSIKVSLKASPKVVPAFPGLSTPQNASGSSTPGRSPSAISPSNPPGPFQALNPPITSGIIKPQGSGRRTIQRDSGLSQNRQKLIQDANALARGLTIAKRQGLIAQNAPDWDKTQSVIALLRLGNSREASARRANMPLSAVNQLIELGQKTPTFQGSPSVPSSPVSPSPRVGIDQPSFPQTSGTPEPLWGPTQPPVSTRQQPGPNYEPLW
jgi:hypothetical protein